jgi:internalin A
MTRALCSFIAATACLTYFAHTAKAGEDPCDWAVIRRFGGVQVLDPRRPDDPNLSVRFLNPTLADCDLACLTPALARVAMQKGQKGKFIVNLSFTNVTDAGVAELARLTTLNDLDLSSTHVHGYGLRRLASLSKLTDLRLNYTLLTLPGLIEFVKELECTQRISLYLRHALGIKHDSALTEFALGLDDDVCKVSGLDLSDNQLRGRGLACICCFRNLTTLSLADNGDLTAYGLKPLARLCNLRTLNLSGLAKLSCGELKPDDCAPITQALLDAIGGLTELQSLDLSRTGQPTDDGAGKLAKLTGLTELKIAGARLSDDGLSTLLSGRTIACTLTKLDISDTPTLATDVGLKAIGKLRNLTSLIASGTGLHVHDPLSQQSPNDDGLSTIGKLSLLEDLDISKTVVTDNGLESLKTLVNLRTFKSNDTKMSNGAVARLQALISNPTSTTRQRGQVHFLKTN